MEWIPESQLLVETGKAGLKRLNFKPAVRYSASHGAMVGIAELAHDDGAVSRRCA